MEKPKVAVAVFIIKDNQILIGKRKGSLGNGTWGVPGGKLDFLESIEDCAKREILEETGLKIKDIQVVTITNDIFKEENEHYVTIFVKSKYVNGTPNILEPNKCEEWKWCEWNKLPEPLFLPMMTLKKANFNPFNNN